MHTTVEFNAPYAIKIKADTGQARSKKQSLSQHFRSN